MTKQRRSFFAEFKRKAAALVLDQDSHIEACRSLGWLSPRCVAG
ncbi:transposase [Pseudomonas fluorescens]|nr:transposase [Pseudomonas fluorescens]